MDGSHRSFDEFVRVDGERLRRVLCARYGIDVGSDAVDAALAWGWEHWNRVAKMANPAGYLYRVATTYAVRNIRRDRGVVMPPEPPPVPESDLDGDLAHALGLLSDPQRLAVVMVHVYGWSPAELAEVTGQRGATVRSHLHRGLRQLRRHLNEGSAP